MSDETQTARASDSGEPVSEGENLSDEELEHVVGGLARRFHLAEEPGPPDDAQGSTGV